MDVHIARQPILDENYNIYAYELLFRSGIRDQESIFHDGQYATAQVIRGAFEIIGLLELTGGKMAFINFTAELIQMGIPSLLPVKYTGIEILEDIEPDPQLIESCRSLKEKGYLLLLDDFIFDRKLKPLIEMADIIKVDFLATRGQERKKILDLPEFKGKFLAEKVETREDYQQGLKLGYSLFQGFYFSKPDLISRREIPAFKLNYFNLLQEINTPEPDYDIMEQIIKGDISISFRLFKIINSAYYGLSERIDSLKHALVLLGINEIKKWLDLYLMGGLGKDKPSILLLNTYVRARFAEGLASEFSLGDRSIDLFMIGLFSLLDVFFGRPLEELLQDLKLEEDVTAALLEQKGVMGEVLKLVESYERASWEQVISIIEENNLDHQRVADIYLEAVTSSQDTIKMVTE